MPVILFASIAFVITSIAVKLRIINSHWFIFNLTLCYILIASYYGSDDFVRLLAGSLLGFALSESGLFLFWLLQKRGNAEHLPYPYGGIPD